MLGLSRGSELPSGTVTHSVTSGIAMAKGGRNPLIGFKAALEPDALPNPRD